MPAKKQITKEMILSTALELLKNGGMEAVNVKALARELNCSTQPVYLSFDSMEALRSELLYVAIDEFLREMKHSHTEINLYGIAYIKFAKKEKKLFQFLFMRQNAFSELREPLSSIMENSITRLMEKYKIGKEEAHNFHDQLWVHTHGIATMIANDFCDWDMKKVERMISECEQYLSLKYGGKNVF